MEGINLYFTSPKVIDMEGRAEDKEEDVQQLNATQIFEAMKQAHPAAMRRMTAYSLSRVLPQIGERIHTMRGNVYRVVSAT